MGYLPFCHGVEEFSARALETALLKDMARVWP
jgi:hypothetical protein